MRSATLRWGTDIPLRLNTIDSNTPMSVEALIDSGATGMFIDIEIIRSKNIWTHRLPRAIPVYNIDGTPNEAGHITEVVDLNSPIQGSLRMGDIPRYGNRLNYDHPRAHMAHGT